MFLSPVNVFCCQEEVSVRGPSLFHRCPTGCGVPDPRPPHC
jgi:hypothetical protein